MRNILLCCLFTAFLTRCGSGDRYHGTNVPLIPAPSPPGDGQIFRGSLEMTPAGSVLSDCGTGKQYAIAATALLDSLYRQACEPVPYPHKTVYAVLRGQLDGDTLAVKGVDALEAKTPWNSCIPFDFWCSGTEPFWDLEISQAEGGFFYQDVSRQQGRKYAWTAPRIDGDTWTYAAAPLPDGQPAIQVVIKKEQANNGMSDLIYHYSATLTVNGETRKGVAVRWGEPKLEPKK